MAIRIEALMTALPGLRAVRWSADGPYTGIKELYAIGRIETGHAEWWSGGKRWCSGPGSLLVRQPGDVHRDLSRDGPLTLQVVTFPAHVVENVTGKVRVYPLLALHDERGAVFHRLLDAIAARADRLRLEVAVAEAISAIARLDDRTGEPTRPVRRALEMLRARLETTVTLDDLAAHAGLDKYHLCRAFRAQVGMPPYAYLTQLRIQRARQLLAAGVAPGEVAARVGLYDQSQLNRHFRRIVGTTPGEYTRGGAP